MVLLKSAPFSLHINCFRSAFQESLHQLCHKIDQLFDKPQQGNHVEKLREVQRKLALALGNVIVNRLADGHLQCGEISSKRTVGFFFPVKNHLLLHVNGVGEMVIIHVKHNMPKTRLAGGLVEFRSESSMTNPTIYCLSGLRPGRNLAP